MKIEWFCRGCGWWVRPCIYLSLIWEYMSTVGPSESKSLCCFFFQGKPPPTPNPEGNRKSKLLQVDLKWRRHPVVLVYMYLCSTASTYPLSILYIYIYYIYILYIYILYILSASLIIVSKCVLCYFCCYRPILWTHVFCRGWTFMPSCCHKAGMAIMKD